jgi:deazaflavin-dependent oxidoreductase (nitroreductase family)
MKLYDQVIETFARTKAGGWFFVTIGTRIDRRLLRWSGGTLSTGLGSRFHRNAVLLETTGAKTGQPRPVPLLATRDEDNLVLVASYGGNPADPAWYRNLKKTPECRVMVDGDWRSYRAREAAGEERERLWRLAATQYGGYDAYQGRVERRIPVVLLEPLKGPR